MNDFQELEVNELFFARAGTVELKDLETHSYDDIVDWKIVEDFKFNVGSAIAIVNLAEIEFDDRSDAQGMKRFAVFNTATNTSGNQVKITGSVRVRGAHSNVIKLSYLCMAVPGY